MAQAEPPPAAPAAPSFDIHIDLSGLAALIWQWLLDHFDEVATAALTWFVQHAPDVGWAIWTPLWSTLSDGMRRSAMAVWDATWNSSANIVTRLPPELTTEFGPYRAIAANPLPLALGGAMLAIVLLGLRTMFGAMVGHDHVITHLSGRLIPAVFLTLAYPVLVASGFGLLNDAASGLGQVAIGQALAFPTPTPGLEMPYALLWLLLIWYAVRLLIRLAYSLFRLLVALVFGPVALILWAIPQTEWVTGFWVRELIGWATTPLLVTACLALAIPLASGRDGFLAAAVFGIAGLQAAYDLVGVLSSSYNGGNRSLAPIAFARSAARMGVGSGAGAAAASVPAVRSQLLADQYGYR